MLMRVSTLCAAMALSLAVSPAFSAGTNLNAPSGKASAVSGPQAITDASASQHFISITPCRAFSSVPLAVSQTKNFQITGSTDFPSQGGPAGGCGIPAYATAVTINLSATAAPSGSYLIAFAAGTAIPSLTSLNMSPNVTVTAGSVVQIGGGGQISIFDRKGATTVFGSITGYYVPAVLSASINSDGTVLRGEGVNTATTARLSTGTYEVGFTRDITECFFQVTAGEGGVGGATPRVTGVTRRSGNPNGVFVRITDNAGTSTDNDYFVSVSCGR